jgi:cytochrome c biogenesis protein CcmG, thiol:disulfide interchange protein DsbE
MGFIRTCATAAALMAVAQPAAARGPKVGKPAPNFELVLMDGSRVKLSQLRGQVVLVNFWATWCAPCKEELPLLDKYYRVASKYGLKMYAVTTEDSLPTKTLKPLFSVMAIPAAKRVKGGALSDVTALPTNYVIDRAGILRYSKPGAFDLDKLNEVLMPLLKEPAPPPVPVTQD